MSILIKYISWFVLTLCSISLCAQTKGIKPVKSAEQQKEGRTRAVVVGISDYQNKDIPDLRFAHKDALLFAEYLKDENGGGVDSSNITVLVNEQATAGKYISALYGLMEEAEEGDNVILYFSGHGDVESTTISQPGFLLCWDAPTRIYMSGGTFGLAYFQEIISTIAQKTKSKVIVITDACRAGKLAGSEIGGAQATAAHLAKQYANEIKILSCQPNEFALESESWGGGRGVFSYHFLRGIQGLADNNEDNIVTLSEISRYLEDMVTPAVDPHSQIPMVVGNRQAKISNVNQIMLSRVKAEDDSQTLSTIDQRSVSITKNDFRDTIRYRTYLEFLASMEKGHLLHPMEGSAWEIYQEISTYDELNEQLGLMKRNLAAALQDDSQQAINKYIASDPEEIKKRWKFDEEFWRYPHQLDKASQLLGENHFYYKPLRARYFYFAGLTKRLDAEKSQDTSIYLEAIALQDSCLSYQSDAVHSINEKGYSYYQMKKYDNAILQYDTAIELVNNWPLVWVNLCYAHNYNNNKIASRKAAERAMDLDSTYMLSHWAMGVVSQSEGDLDKALEYYNSASVMEPDIGFIYTRLGEVYSLVEDYDMAYNMALRAIRYDTTDMVNLINMAHSCLDVDSLNLAKYYFDLLKLNHPNALESYQGLIEFYFYSNDLENARLELLNYLEVYPSDEFAYYLLASIYGGQKDVESSIDNLELAFIKGFNDIEVLKEDPNLLLVRSNTRYALLIKKYNLK